MEIRSVHFKKHPCFKSEWSGFDSFAPVNLIIGKNNTGKSHLLSLLKELTQVEVPKLRWDIRVTCVLDEEALKTVFRPRELHGVLGGSHWQNHGELLVDDSMTWLRENGIESILTYPERIDQVNDNRSGLAPAQLEERKSRLIGLCSMSSHWLHGRRFRQLNADRDIRPEALSNQMTLSWNGSGATNIVRRFLISSDPDFPRELVQKDMLEALNSIFEREGRFTEIAVQHHDGGKATDVLDEWEIFLGQEHKGLVSLSNSGSGLKTIFLVLINLLLIPKIEGKKLKTYVFAFEELENNLHPSLVRRLLAYICKFTNPAKTNSDNFPVFFLTTHASVALDFFAADRMAQIVHVSHDGKTGSTRTVDQSSKAYAVVWDLGTRPSDLLQANGVIWVEGPSDRIYVNRWIELYSGGRYKEGRHYQCAFYGGGLLANLQATMDDEQADTELINLLKINPNAIVISDSDRKSISAHFKARVRRIRDEFANLDPARAFHWILSAREIENYLIPEFFDGIEGISVSVNSAPGQFESFFPKHGEESYLEQKIGRKTFDKSKLAALTTSNMTLEALRNRFDLDDSMKRLLELIEIWNL